MLVLTRKLEESIVINGEVEIKIVDVSGDRVKLGIDAPKSYKVFRKELLTTVQTNIEAAEAAPRADMTDFMSKFKKMETLSENKDERKQ